MSLTSRIMLPVLLSLALLLPAGISCAQEQTVAMSPEDLTTLETSLNSSETELRQSLTELETARELLLTSEQELTDLATALDESETACNELKLEQVRLKAELAKLSSELARLKSMSMTQSAQLKKAEQSLNDTEAKYKAERKREERQKRMWQVIAVVLAGVAATR